MQLFIHSPGNLYSTLLEGSSATEKNYDQLSWLLLELGFEQIHI